MKYFIKTMGCQMNVHDSEKIAGILSEGGMEQSDVTNDADVIVLNTCSIREKAEQKFFSELGRLKKVKEKNPHLKIAVAGCIARQRGATLFSRFRYVDFVFGPDNIDSLQNWIQDRAKTAVLDDNPGYHHKLLPAKREGRVRAWVSIMYGCDNFCTYCVVPYTRGRERSRTPDDIYHEVESLAEQGFREVTLLGQNVNSYGKYLSESIDFPDLLVKLHEVNGIGRIRFVTSHPRNLSDRLIHAMRDLPKVCEHLHLPLQSGSDRILRLMNRGYTMAEYRKRVDLLRNAIPEIALTTDIITGFPGELDEDFELTMKAISEIGYDGLFAFKYSKRPDTKAALMPGHIDEHTKSGRLSAVFELQDAITGEKNRTLEGRTMEVLVEGISETDRDRLTGRTRTNKIVNFSGDKSDIGHFVKIKILEAKQHSLYGELSVNNDQ